jgi:hypothetical protein
MTPGLRPVGNARLTKKPRLVGQEPVEALASPRACTAMSIAVIAAVPNPVLGEVSTGHAIPIFALLRYNRRAVHHIGQRQFELTRER